MKKLLFSLFALTALCFAQTPDTFCKFAYPNANGVSTVTGGTWVIVDTAVPPTNTALCDFHPVVTQNVFDAAYWAAQPVAVQALRFDPNVDTAVALAKAGYTIDGTIMVWNWDPYYTMLSRIQAGYTWTPSYLQSPITVAPGLIFNGQSYNPTPPAGSVKTSLDLKDYPNFTPPPTPVVGTVIGAFGYVNAQGQKIFYGGAADSMKKYPNGAVFTDAMGTFQKVAVQNPFGWSSYWIQIAPPGAKPVAKKAVKKAVVKK